MSRTFRLTAAVLAGVALAAPAARAQNAAAVAQRSNVIEIGADAGAVFGLGSDSFINVDLPAQKGRIGFFLNNDSRVSIEPALGFSIRNPESAPSTTTYIAEVGALYHFQPATLITEATNRQNVAYVRPFLGFEGQTTGGDTKNDNDFYAGAGVGLKIPVRTNIAIRTEANVGYGFNNEAARIGLNLGLSFFTRRAQ